MPSVIRDHDGRIVALAEPGPDEQGEVKAFSDPEVQAFLRAARAQLSSSDAETIRVIEDLVDVLIRKGVILLTDLPDAAREKLTLRRQMRNEISVLGDLMVGEDDIL